MEGDNEDGSYTTYIRQKFQSTPSAWRETDGTPRTDEEHYISIHSLRMEGDADSVDCHPSLIYFNPLPPHGGRPDHRRLMYWRSHFNPLPPHGGRRRPYRRPPWAAIYFNPLPPHGGRRAAGRAAARNFDISIHSLRMEGDVLYCRFLLTIERISIHSLRMEGDLLHCLHHTQHCTFQSTPSAWRETFARNRYDSAMYISIHSLRMEGDHRRR